MINLFNILHICTSDLVALYLKIPFWNKIKAFWTTFWFLNFFFFFPMCQSCQFFLISLYINIAKGSCHKKNTHLGKIGSVGMTRLGDRCLAGKNRKKIGDWTPSFSDAFINGLLTYNTARAGVAWRIPPPHPA